MSNQLTALDRYLSVINKIELITRDELVSLSKSYLSGDQDAKKKMIRHNLKLVIKFGKGYTNDPDTLMDLIQEGNLGLIRAAEKYDPYKLNPIDSKPYAFSTYAQTWIRYFVEKSLCDNQKMTKVPLHMMKLTRKIFKIHQALEGKDEKFDAEKFALENKVKIGSVYAAISIMIPETSMQATTSNEDGNSSEFQDTLSTHVEHDINDVESGKNWLEIQVSNLPTKQQDAVIHTFGLYNTMSKSGEETGKIIGVTRERVRQLVLLAKEKLLIAAKRDNVSLSDFAV